MTQLPIGILKTIVWNFSIRSLHQSLTDCLIFTINLTSSRLLMIGFCSQNVFPKRYLNQHTFQTNIEDLYKQNTFSYAFKSWIWIILKMQYHNQNKAKNLNFLWELTLSMITNEKTIVKATNFIPIYPVWCEFIWII